jgi:adenosine deaminase
LIPSKYDGLAGMIDFIYENLNMVMLTSDDVIFFMENAIESSIDDNVTLLEASVDIGLARFFNGSIEEVIDIVIELKERYKSQIEFRQDIGIKKDLHM